LCADLNAESQCGRLVGQKTQKEDFNREQRSNRFGKSISQKSQTYFGRDQNDRGHARHGEGGRKGLVLQQVIT
jgi:hypothetical protein